MSTDQGRHLAMLRDRARRPDDHPARTGRDNAQREAIEQDQAADEPEFYDDEEF